LQRQEWPWRHTLIKPNTTLGDVMGEQLLLKALHASGITKKDRYSLDEVRRIIGAPITTIRRQLRDGSLVGQRTGRKWQYVYHDDLANSMDGNK